MTARSTESEGDGDEHDGDEHDHAAEEAEPAQPVGVKNYITPSGLQRLIDEHRFLLTRERRAVTQVVAWAAEQRRSQRKRRLSVRQTAAARDRSADSLSHQANRCRGSGGPGSPEKRAGGDAGLLRGDRALRQRRWNGAGGEHRRPRRGRSGPQPHQLDVATGARVDEVRTGRLAWSCARRARRSNCRSSRCVTSASPWSPSANHPGPSPRPGLVLPPAARCLSGGTECPASAGPVAARGHAIQM